MKVDRLLELYCTMDTSMRAELLAAVGSFIGQGRVVEYRNETYHHIEDLKVDIEAHCASLHNVPADTAEVASSTHVAEPTS